LEKKKQSLSVNGYTSSGVKKFFTKFSVKTFVSFTAGDVGTSRQASVANIFTNFFKAGKIKNL
jgi:hypothetical protein